MRRSSVANEPLSGRLNLVDSSESAARCLGRCLGHTRQSHNRRYDSLVSWLAMRDPLLMIASAQRDVGAASQHITSSSCTRLVSALAGKRQRRAGARAAPLVA
jgi:hypothetical protein